ncbi:MAG TPA: glycosyltransferase [Vicinamibacterales bacterium]|nr:glycosyltransferase [Vicinamibacterales bacterium]
MRICHVSPHLPPDQAANALLPAELGRWAAGRGDDVVFAAHEPAQGRGVADALAGPVTWIPRRERSNAAWRALRLDAWRQMRLITAALDRAARGAQLLHLHSNGLIIEVAAAWAGRHRVPYILTLYGTEIWHYRRRWPIDPFRRAYMRAAAVTFYSQRLVDKARELGLDRRRLSVIYPAVAVAFAPQNEPTRAAWRDALGIHEPHVILNVKRLHELAGQRFLIEAFARVARGRHDLRLVICGTGPLKQDLEALVHSLGIERRVTFTGLVANDAVARYAAVADVFVLPSLLEALPTVAVEALASGTPVISADHPGGVELHGIFGDDVLVVPKGNVDALARALQEFLAAPARVRPDTLDLVAKHFGPDAVHAAYDAVYRRAVEGGK